MEYQRLIEVKDIPESLRCTKSGKLRLPEPLRTSWLSLLDGAGLREKAMKKAPRTIAGGITKKSTDDHLAWRFTGSAARVQLAMLGIGHKYSQVSDAFARIFSGGKVLLADAPSGSGASALSVLSVLADLRSESVIPRTPLEVLLVGGEISEYARYYFDAALNDVRETLNKQAIFLEFESMHWDVCDPVSNSDYIRRLTILGDQCGARMLLLANFSYFLQREGKFNDAQPQFNELFRHFRNDNCSAIWIEPQKKEVISESGGFIDRLIQKLSSLPFLEFLIGGDEDSIVLKDDCKVINVFDSDRYFRTTLAVLRFDLRN